MSEPLRYLFPPPERRRVLGPFAAGQLATLGAVAMVSVFGVIRTSPTPRGLMAGMALLGLTAAAVVVPVRGRVATEWVPLTLRYGLARFRGHTDFRARTPLHGQAASSLPLPAEVGDLQMLAHPQQESILGVVVDRTAGLYSAALEVEGPPFLLEPTGTQEQLLGRWGSVLARLAGPGSELRRLQWILRTTSDDAAALMEDLRAARPRDAAGGGDLGACAVLTREVDTLARELADLGVEVRRRLDPRSYQGIIRVAFDPAAQVELDTLARVNPGQGWGSDWPWPMATEERWGYYRTADRAWHRSFTLALPLGEVPADWFVPMLLGDSTVGRTVAMTVQPVSRRQANRAVTRTLTRLMAEEERKQRLGQLHTAQDAKQESAAVQRMEELADGHADVLYAVTVTVTAPDLETLDQACQSVDHVAGMASCELRQLEGQQAQAFTWTLPLARGVDEKRRR